MIGIQFHGNETTNFLLFAPHRCRCELSVPPSQFWPYILNQSDVYAQTHTDQCLLGRRSSAAAATMHVSDGIVCVLAGRNFEAKRIENLLTSRTKKQKKIKCEKTLNYFNNNNCENRASRIGPAHRYGARESISTINCAHTVSYKVEIMQSMRLHCGSQQQHQNTARKKKYIKIKHDSITERVYVRRQLNSSNTISYQKAAGTFNRKLCMLSGT